MENLKDFMTELNGFNVEQMGAVAYNRIIKKHLSLENKLELLYIDLLAYVANDLGDKKYDAIKKVINTFKPWEKDDSVKVILAELKYINEFQDGNIFLNPFSIEALKEAVEVVLNADDMEALLDRIKVKLFYFGDGDMNEKEVLEAVLNDKFHRDYRTQLMYIITRAVAKKYYNYFYRDLEISLNKIIDNYSESLEPKVKELIAKKEANQ